MNSDTNWYERITREELIEELPKDEQLKPLNQPDTSNATYIDWQSLDDNEHWTTDYYCSQKTKYFKKLDEMNSGERNGLWANVPYRRLVENHHIVRSIASQLDLTAQQREDAEYWFYSLDLQDWYPYKEEIAFCLCACIVHNDAANTRKVHPQTPENEKDELFQKMETILEYDEIPRLGKRPFDSTFGKLQHYMRTNDRPTSYPDKYAKFGFGSVDDPITDVEFAEIRASAVG